MRHSLGQSVGLKLLQSCEFSGACLGGSFRSLRDGTLGSTPLLQVSGALRDGKQATKLTIARS